MGRVGNRYVWHGGQTENQGEQTKKIFSALRAEFCPPWPETLPAPLVVGDFPQTLRPIVYALQNFDRNLPNLVAPPTYVSAKCLVRYKVHLVV